MAEMLAWPVRVEAGRLATVPYGSVDEQSQHVAVLLATRPGERVAVPGYGTPDPVGVRAYDAEAVLAAAARWCPHAEVVSLDAALDAVDTRRLDVAVAVRRR